MKRLFEGKWKYMRLARSRVFIIFYTADFAFFLAKMTKFVIMRRIEDDNSKFISFNLVYRFKSKGITAIFEFAVNFC